MASLAIEELYEAAADLLVRHPCTSGKDGLHRYSGGIASEAKKCRICRLNDAAEAVREELFDDEGGSLVDHQIDEMKEEVPHG